MTASERELVRIELSRAMRDDLASVPALALLDEIEVDPRPIDGVCRCGRLLEAGDGLLCGECAEVGGFS